MSESKQTRMIEIHSFSEIPKFQIEAEEAEFWASHCMSDELLEQMKPILEDVLPPPRKNSNEQSAATEAHQGNY